MDTGVNTAERNTGGRGGTTAREVAFPCGDVVLRGDRWSGAGGAGSLLFLHGGGQTRHSWGAAARLLAADGWDCTTLDLRGHGDSDWAPDGDYRLARFVADIRHVVSRAPDRPVIVGASLGGLTALLLEGHHRVARALVLVDIVPRPRPDGRRRIHEFMARHLDGFASLEEVADAVAAYNRRPRRRNPDGLRKNVRQHADGRWYWHWDPALMRLASGALLPDPDEVLRAARRIDVPVLLIRGGRSDVVDHDGAAELLEVVEKARVVEVAEAGHMVAGDDNDVFVDAVRAFLAELRD